MSSSKKIRVLVFRVGEAPVVEEIDDTLEASQAVVGGFLEAVGLDEHVSLYCNEEGKLLGLPQNRSVPGDVICGNFYIGRHDDDGEAVSLTDFDIARWSREFE